MASGLQGQGYTPSMSTVATPNAREDHLIVIEGATWADCQRQLELRGERSVPRIAFLPSIVQDPYASWSTARSWHQVFTRSPRRRDFRSWKREGDTNWSRSS